jgi:hypothetical protein
MTDIKSLKRIGFELQLISKGILSFHTETETSGDLTICRAINNPEYYRLVKEWDDTHDDNGSPLSKREV